MKEFRITYRMEVYIQAETEEQAQEIFDNRIDIFNLGETPEEVVTMAFVEQVSIDEEI